jgi:hypothetical protein
VRLKLALAEFETLADRSNRWRHSQPAFLSEPRSAGRAAQQGLNTKDETDAAYPVMFRVL